MEELVRVTGLELETGFEPVVPARIWASRPLLAIIVGSAGHRFLLSIHATRLTLHSRQRSTDTAEQDASGIE